MRVCGRVRKSESDLIECKQVRVKLIYSNPKSSVKLKLNRLRLMLNVNGTGYIAKFFKAKYANSETVLSDHTITITVRTERLSVYCSSKSFK